MAAPDWFKRTDECAIHKVQFVNYTTPMKKHMQYCPKCREIACLNESRERRLREGGAEDDGSLQGEAPE